MNLRQWMHLDLGALLRGRGVKLAASMPEVPWRKRPWRRRLFAPFLHRSNKTQNLIQVTDQLHQLVTCQAPLVEGLKHAASDCPSLPVSNQLYRLAQSLEQGGTLAEGLRRVPAFCPRYYMDLVGVAETSGHLSETLLDLSRDLGQGLKTSHKLRSRTIYILVLLTFTLAIGTFLYVKVFSVLDDVWGEFGGTVGRGMGFWKLLVDSTGFLQQRVSSAFQVFNQFLVANGSGSSYWGGLFPAFILFVLADIGLLAMVVALFYLLRPPAKFVVERLPIIRGALFHARWGHALNVVSMLLGRGIPLDQALDSAAASDVDRSTRRVLLRMSGKTRAGLSFPEVLRKEGRRVPQSLSSVVVFGNQVGRLPDLLSRLSRIYRLRAERTVRVVSDIVFPIAVIGCGVLIATINTRFFILMTNIVDGIMGNM